jgi:hypothetical protein
VTPTPPVAAVVPTRYEYEYMHTHDMVLASSRRMVGYM